MIKVIDARMLFEVLAMDIIYQKTMLFDFYGELLTAHQRSIYEDAVYNDMSLAEIAEEQGISRQGVHDLIKRCDKILWDYESKLHLVERFNKAKKTVREIQQLSVMETDKELAEGRLKRIELLSRELLEEL